MNVPRCVLASLIWTILTVALWVAARANPVTAISAEDRDALGRVAYAEAGSQGEEGLAAVTHAVMNRVASGGFGTGVQGVLDAPGQFEPVGRAGGTWRGLPPLSESQRLVFGTILDLILQGRLPDLTGGSTYFQNPTIVAQRAATGLVSPGLVNFGGQIPAAVVRDHSFYRAGGGTAGPHGPAPEPQRRDLAADQPTAAFYRVVHGRLIQVGAFANPTDPASPSAKLIRVGALRAAQRIHVLRGAGALGAGPPPAS